MLEKAYFETLEQFKRDQGITDHQLYHYDTPLTAEHEMELLKQAGFSGVKPLARWGTTFTLSAVRPGGGAGLKRKLRGNAI